MTLSSFERRGRSTINSSPTNISNDISAELKVGVRAQVQGKVGVIRFIGTTSFQTGKWIGIELDEPQGKNSGVVQGKRYFECKTGHGVFVRPSQVKIYHQEEKFPPSSKSNSSLHQFAPMQDPNLAAARTIQLNTPSHSSTLLPSRISRLPQTSTSKTRKTTIESNKPSRTPKIGIASPTQKEYKLQQIRLQQQQQQRIQQEQQELTEQPKYSFKRRNEEEERKKEERKLPVEEEETEESFEYNDSGDEISDDQEDRDELIDDYEENELHQSETEEEDDDYDETGSVAYTISNPVSRTTSTTLPKAIGGNYQQMSHYGSLEANLPVSKSEQMIPLKDYEELRLKLKILETKRQEDREKYREHEKVKEEAEQFLTLRNKLQDKISELQKDLRETKKQLKDATSEQENYESKYNDMIESLEMITLDKEVAEERAENLQQEVNLLKDKIEEISVDLDILKKEADIINRVPDKDGGEEKTPLEVIQLERHNERLKEALMRLRDATTARENELLEKIKDLERDTYELEEVKNQYSKTRDRLQVTEAAVDDLKELLDDALGAEDLVEQLTEKNLSLTEKLEELHMVIEDLEALKELADELEENHIETEKQLEAEIDHRDMLLREQLERIRSAEETNADYEATIQQFRELVTTLQNDLEQLRSKEVDQQSEKRTLSSQSQAMMSLNMQLQSTVMKAQAKSIDLELRKLDVAQANDRLSYIQPYLPDSFFKTENDAISCILLYKRLVFKSELIIKHLDQNHPISEKINVAVPENLIAVCEMRQRAGWLGDLSKRFVTFIENCQPMTFIKMGQVFHDLIGTERRLTSIVELLRTDEINETECVTELQRMIAQLEHLSDVHLVQNGEANHVDQFFGLTRALDLNADRMTVELTFVRQIVANAAQSEDIVITESRERLDYDYLEPLGRLVVQAKKSKILSKKLLRQLEDLSEQALTLNSEYLHRFKTLYAISSKLGRFCYETYKQITAYVNEKVGGKEQISLALIQQIVYNKANEILEIAESTLWEGCLKTLKSLTNELSTAFERIQNENKTEKIISGTAPWIQRASDMKAEVVMNHDMERKVQQHSEEILKLIKDVKLKDQLLQESNVKIELLEKRMETVKKQADQIMILEETLQKTQDQEQMYAEAMENLQAEYDALEQENIKLKKNASKKEEKRISLPKKSDFSLNEAITLETESTNVYEANTETEALKAAIRYLRAENAHLKGSDLVRSLKMGGLPKIVPHSRSNIKKEVVDKMDNNDDDVRSIIRSFALETRMLVKDIRAINASPKVVQLSLDCRGPRWNRKCKLPDYQYQSQQSVLHTLNQRCEQLKQKMSHIQNRHVELTPVSPLEGLKLDSNMLPLTIAKIVLPAQSKTNTNNKKKQIQLQSIKDFEHIHSLFIR